MAEASMAAPRPTTMEIQSLLAAHADKYCRWIFSEIEPFLGNRILDVGCAIGNITQYYIDRELIVGVDVVAEELAVARERFVGKNFESHLLDVSSPELLQLADRKLDTAVMLNVLEHVEDDVNALRNLRQTLIPGGRLCLLVPVNKWLYGPMDAIDHHYRRYTRAEMNAKLAEAGFILEHQNFFNMLGILAWFIQNRIVRKSMAAPAQYSLFDSLVPALSRIERAVPPPAGLSLVSICRTPQ